MRWVCLAAVMTSSVVMAGLPSLNAPWCSARHEKLVSVDRKAIDILKRWDKSRRMASIHAIQVSARSTVEASAMLDRLLEVGQQASEDAARCTSAGFKSTSVQKAAYRRNEVDFRRVELLLAELHDSWTALVESDREMLMAEVRRSGLLETL